VNVRQAFVPSASPVEPQRDHSSPRRLVLYIEDDAANVRLIERIVKAKCDADLAAARDGARGIELARTHLPDLILLDMHLPDMTGQSIAEAIKADPATRSIPIAGDADASALDRLLDKGISGYVTKPFDIAEIVEVVDRHAIKPGDCALAPTRERVLRAGS
jgi:CheY-like chemotaxis protein